MANEHTFLQRKAALVYEVWQLNGWRDDRILACAELIDLTSGYRMGQLASLRALRDRIKYGPVFELNWEIDPQGYERYDVQRKESSESYYGTLDMGSAKRVIQHLNALTV